MSDQTYKDQLSSEVGDFIYGSGESPDYVEYIPEALGLLDIYFDTVPGTEDAIRMLKLARAKFWRDT